MKADARMAEPAPHPSADIAGVALVGPTASGKSALALALSEAAAEPTEILVADSMQVYRGMDIGTAKPTADERRAVPHHLIDLAEPTEEFAVATYQRVFTHTVTEVHARGARPLLVGGTGLYVRAAVDRLAIPGQFPAVRAQLEDELDTETLHRRLRELDPEAAARMEPTNRRRVVRALEVTLGSGRPFSSYGPGLAAYPATGWRLIGLSVPRDELDRRIGDRYRAQLADGFLDEVRGLLAGPPLSRTASQALGYRELIAHLEGRCTLDEALETAIVRTRQFARRQERWFRRDPRITWIAAGEHDKPLAALDHVLRD